MSEFIKKIPCPKCNTEYLEDVKSVPSDLIFLECKNCDYQIAISPILNTSIILGNKTYEEKLSKLIIKENHKTIFTTIDEGEDEREKNKSDNWNIIRISSSKNDDI